MILSEAEHARMLINGFYRISWNNLGEASETSADQAGRRRLRFSFFRTSPDQGSAVSYQ